MDARERYVLGRQENLIGQSRESKRKLPPVRVVEKAQMLNAIQSISNKPMGRAQPPSNQNASPYEVVKPTRHASVKDKRALAHLKETKTHCKGADENGKAQSSAPMQTRYRPV